MFWILRAKREKLLMELCLIRISDFLIRVRGETIHYAPNFEEVNGAYWFRVVRLCVHSSHFLMHAISYEPCMLGFWNFIYEFLMEIQLTVIFFFSELSLFLELYPFEKIRMTSDVCYILLTVHARVLKFHIWIPHGKIADPYFFLPFWSYAPLKTSEWKLVSKISRKLFELGAWNLVSW